jgi:alpha-ribazole phosphatase
VLCGKKLIHTDDRLMELNFGDWEMKSWEEINKLPEARSWFDDYLHLPCPNGESYEQLQDRIWRFSEGFRTLQDDANVLIVTHAGCIRSFLNLLDGQDPSKMFHRPLSYGQIIRLSYPPQPNTH